MVAHLTIDKPKPLNAPYLPAIVGIRHIQVKNPIQLKKNETINDVIKMQSVPISELLTSV